MSDMMEQRAELQNLTRKEKLILDYFIRNQRAACFMTASEIGQALGVGASSVVRLARKLGFDSYTAMRRALQQEAAASKPPPKREPIPYEKLAGNVHLSDGQLLAAYTQQVINHINTDTNPATEEKLSEIADAVLEADRVFVAGFRACSGFASTLVTMLTCCRSNVFPVGHQQPMVDQLVSLTDRDLLIAISFSRYSRDTLFAAQMARDSSCKVAVMTDSYTAPLAEYGDIVVINSVDNFSFFNAYAGFVTNMEKMVLLVGHRSLEQTQQRLKCMEHYLERTNQY